MKYLIWNLFTVAIESHENHNIDDANFFEHALSAGDCAKHLHYFRYHAIIIVIVADNEWTALQRIN